MISSWSSGFPAPNFRWNWSDDIWNASGRMGRGMQTLNGILPCKNLLIVVQLVLAPCSSHIAVIYLRELSVRANIYNQRFSLSIDDSFQLLKSSSCHGVFSKSLPAVQICVPVQKSTSCTLRLRKHSKCAVLTIVNILMATLTIRFSFYLSKSGKQATLSFRSWGIHWVTFDARNWFPSCSTSLDNLWDNLPFFLICIVNSN